MRCSMLIGPVVAVVREGLLMHRHRFACWSGMAGVLLLVILTPSLVRAAPSSEVLFEDNFATFNADLGKQYEGQAVKDNALHFAVDSLTWTRKLYQSKRFGNADVTLRVRLTNATANAGGQVGLVFWADNPDDFYALTIVDSGTCGVQ